MDKGKGHYSLSFKPGDLCFEVTDSLLFPGDLSWVFGSGKEEKWRRNGMKVPSLFKAKACNNKETNLPILPRHELDGDNVFKDQPLEGNPTNTSTWNTRKTLLKQRRSGRLKRVREKFGDPITPDSLRCPICLEKFTAGEITDLRDCIGCSKCGRWVHHVCSGLQKACIG